ncbi:nucleotide sugar dehydrogenase [Saccharopolyspora phatthalungensis]|uniref:Nucleotide sugar dehydrogenase n=1 Tax=Saccharopolyspora phatthalungensis TaxID=664693 RepID=A0A840QIZ8_9PSEU|nr:nucleotide sugar dehydrogenase [Saccharopolyspora phatthalungensis]MBB5158799.1 nucleotide sugar dehydrogenase [Saccharopolyspora phatthalungensis]
MPVDLVVVGLGYVGLPLARRSCSAGLSTVGYDVSASVVDGLNAGRSHISDISEADIAEMRSAGFRATSDPSAIHGAETVVICVPTGLSADGQPDLGAVRAASRSVAAHLRAGTLVVLESTSYPGTTEEIVRPILERESGLRVGEDFHLAFSPERIDPGNAHFGIHNTPKVVSGCTPLCAKHAVAFYGRLVETLVVSRGTREAEMAKLLENTYRYVNIALVNEVALFCDQIGIDVWDVLHCAATKPFGFAPFSPGAGVGGHCIPVDPRYLAAKADVEGFSFRMLSAAQDVLSRMPEHVVGRATALLSELGKPLPGARVVLLGVSYKPDVADTRESPAAPVARGLRERGVEVVYHDPHVPEFGVDGLPMSRVASLVAALAGADLAILLQDHSCFDMSLLARADCTLLDTRGKVAGARVTLL